ncbi:HAMP domain-containing histidine kinase [Clostridium botulinum]|uniref:sensor histidine kinase n=1 Tax=Clostridium TaxID=1485 RepID=UPI001A91E262|nr:MULTISPECIES: HAMP domain-containing sensor histidine kinase [Clostridium]MBO0523628.1 HAMP domain-containing histidine kinase [Clostridium botulinum]MBO0529199.1 HAMP domain-containing histidine kinase [Clostridium botulinum]MBO0532735.1 HAMP domain-containing histidine kinase [Clostridium botulinum]MBO0540087.1 HAMP domain-containing histidine kinase [Clostridium botulinum]MBO0546359.1 HAMP domain-containing histidine kinase [Clostridium botulinum]
MKNRIKRLFNKMIKPFKYVYKLISYKVKKSVRLELIFTFALCFLMAIMTFIITNSYLTKASKYSEIDYDRGINEIHNYSLSISDEINRQKLKIEDKKIIQEIIDTHWNVDKNNKIFIANTEGKILFKVENVEAEKVDIFEIIKNNIQLQNIENYKYDYDIGRKEFVSINPLIFENEKAYIIVQGIPRAETVYYTKDKSVSAFFLAVIVFIFGFLFITKRKMNYIEQISTGLLQISKGNLDYRVKRVGNDELALLADNINYMAKELSDKIEKERKIEKAKNDLITNVSHDLRTPLTSIMGYLGLIKEKKFKSEKELMEYANVAYNKSEKLKNLIQDLFSYTKYTNDRVALNKQRIILAELLDQLIEELVPICEENKVSINKYAWDSEIVSEIDADKMVRVFENLIMNAIRYSIKPGEIKINLYKERVFSMVSISNKSEEISKEDLKKLFDRFYRLDKSRTASTGGSGLGLAIAKSIVEMHKGSIWAEYQKGYITFYIKLIMVEDE